MLSMHEEANRMVGFFVGVKPRLRGREVSLTFS